MKNRAPLHWRKLVATLLSLNLALAPIATPAYGAATRLGIAAAGTGEVEVERLTNAQIASGEWRGRPADAGAAVPVAP